MRHLLPTLLLLPLLLAACGPTSERDGEKSDQFNSNNNTIPSNNSASNNSASNNSVNNSPNNSSANNSPNNTPEDAGVEPPDATPDPADAAPDATADATADASPDPVCPLPPEALQSTQATANGRYEVFQRLPAPDGLPARDVVVFLPEGYDADPTRRYPVLYMHDGQNLFDDRSAAFGTAWEVDETLDTLTDQGHTPPWIVVGLANTPLRIDEYTPDADPEYGGGRGEAYGRFLVEHVKPLIDARYRTRCGRDDTAVAGSSLGGLISLDLYLRYPEVFGRVAALSPSLWWNDRSMLQRLQQATPSPLPSRLWLDAGTAEGSPTPTGTTTVAANAADARDAFLRLGLTYGDHLGYLEVVGAEHNEAAWERRLPDLFTFLLADAPLTARDPSALTLHLDRPNLPVGEATHVNLQATWDDARLSWPLHLADLTLEPAGIAEVRGDTLVALAPGTVQLTARLRGQLAQATLQVGQTSDVQVRFVVRVPQGTDQVWLRGDLPQLGAWDGQGVQLQPIDLNVWSATLLLPPNTPLLYKYTRGSWQTVEKTSGGEEVDNRRANSGPEGAHLDDVVARWADL